MWLRCDVCRRYAQPKLAGLPDVEATCAGAIPTGLPMRTLSSIPHRGAVRATRSPGAGRWWPRADREVSLAVSRASSTPRAEGRLELFRKELEEEILIGSDLIEHDMVAAKRDILGNGL